VTESPPPVGPIVWFYRGAGTDHAGRSINQVWTFDDEQLEAVHDYVQWLFPTPEPSAYSADAPTLAAPDIEAFKADAELGRRLLASFRLMLHFYGLAMEEGPAGPIISPSARFAQRRGQWSRTNHNNLRLTRILRSLTILGQERHAAALLACLERIARDNTEIVAATTLAYWREAVQA
jgi:hypothetical protein